MLVTWPFVMLLLDYWPLRRLADVTSKKYRRGASNREATTGIVSLVREKLPLFSIVAASAVITFVAQSHDRAVRTIADAPIALRLSNALVSYAKYFLRTFCPRDLAVYYPFAPSGIPTWQMIGAAFLLIAITAFCFFRTENATVLPRGLALVSGNTGSCYRLRSGWRANHGRPLLLYSINRFVHCSGVRISGHRQELACCAMAQCWNRWCGSPDACYSY